MRWCEGVREDAPSPPIVVVEAYAKPAGAAKAVETWLGSQPPWPRLLLAWLGARLPWPRRCYPGGAPRLPPRRHPPRPAPSHRRADRRAPPTARRRRWGRGRGRAVRRRGARPLHGGHQTIILVDRFLTISGA